MVISGCVFLPFIVIIVNIVFDTTVTEHGVTEQWSYTDSDLDFFCTLSGLAAHYFSLLQQAWQLLWVDQGSSPRLRKTAQN
jgi:hypothetical protein